MGIIFDRNQEAIKSQILWLFSSLRKQEDKVEVFNRIKEDLGDKKESTETM